MATTVTVRDVPDEVRDALAQQALERGQSLQSFLLRVLRRQASFTRNRDLLAEVEAELLTGGGAGADPPDAADVLTQLRRQRLPQPIGEPEASFCRTGLA